MKTKTSFIKKTLFYFGVFTVGMILGKILLTPKQNIPEEKRHLPALEVSHWDIEWKNEFGADSLIGESGSGSLTLQHDYFNKQTRLILTPKDDERLGFEIVDDDSYSFLMQPYKDPEALRNIVANNVAFGYPFDIHSVLSGMKWKDNVYDVHPALLLETAEQSGKKLYLKEGNLIFHLPQNNSKNVRKEFPSTFVMKSEDGKFKITFKLKNYQIFTGENLPLDYAPFESFKPI